MSDTQFDNDVNKLKEELKQPNELTVDTTAAAINALSRDIGEWADRKGFREDWSDADFLDELAIVLRRIGPSGLGSAVPDKLETIAKEHRRLANVCKLMLMVSELSEALEGMRDGGNYDEELGDLAIRLMENAHKNNIPIGDIIMKKVAVNEDRPYKHGRQF